MILKNLSSNVKKGCVLASKGMEEFSTIENKLEEGKMRMIPKT
jgi:hypothetical protein